MSIAFYDTTHSARRRNRDFKEEILAHIAEHGERGLSTTKLGKALRGDYAAICLAVRVLRAEGRIPQKFTPDARAQRTNKVSPEVARARVMEAYQTISRAGASPTTNAVARVARMNEKIARRTLEALREAGEISSEPLSRAHKGTPVEWLLRDSVPVLPPSCHADRITFYSHLYQSGADADHWRQIRAKHLPRGTPCDTGRAVRPHRWFGNGEMPKPSERAGEYDNRKQKAPRSWR